LILRQKRAKNKVCSGGDKTAKASEVSAAAFQNTLQGSFQTAFGANQAILNTLTAKLTDTINNPKGFDPKTFALLKTGASDTVARQTEQAQIAASSAMARHGGPDLGSGVEAQVHGEIGAAGATEQARESSNIDIASGELQNENYWRAISGLTNVAQAENPTGYAGAANSSAESVSSLSRSVLASQQAGWQNTFGIISGIAGLGSAAIGAYNSFGGAKPGTGGTGY
jgi:hypothetical protein